MADTRQVVKWQLELPGLTDDISGSFDFYVYFDKIAELIGRLDRLGLNSAFANSFLITDPIYYGWFVGPNLTHEQCSLLKALVVDLSSNEHKIDHGLPHFIAALDVVISGTGLLNVALTPPGHTDNGFYTIFCHCPRCKADSGLPQWKREYPSEPMLCAVCGFEYSPAPTMENSKMYDFEDVQCMSCLEIIKRTDFAAETQDYIDDHLGIRKLETELRMLKLVFEFEQRHPGVKPRRHWIERVRVLDDQEYSWDLDDRRVVMYTRFRRFDNAARIQFVEAAINDARTIEIPLVTCPLCYGALF